MNPNDVETNQPNHKAVSSSTCSVRNILDWIINYFVEIKVAMLVLYLVLENIDMTTFFFTCIKEKKN